MNWQNIVTVKNKIPDIQEFAAKAKEFSILRNKQISKA